MLDQMSMPVLFVVVFVLLGLAVLGVLVTTRVLGGRQAQHHGPREARRPRIGRRRAPK